MIDGQRRLIRSGSLPYFRLPTQALWRDRLSKMRAAGLNAVTIDYPWSYHSHERGAYDFTEFRDVDRLHDLIEELGFFLIARPGPYVCADLDLGGLPAWLLSDREVILRCRTETGVVNSLKFLEATRDWFKQIVPRFASRRNLILVQIENEFTFPAPMAHQTTALTDLLVRWFGTKRIENRLRRDWERDLERVEPGSEKVGVARGQQNAYMYELRSMVTELGVNVPVLHNDLASRNGRQMDVDLLGVDRYPLMNLPQDWRDNPAAFDAFQGDRAALDAHRETNPLLYPELQAGLADQWGGEGFASIRERFGADAIDNLAKAALTEGAAAWNYYTFCGGTNWGYMGSPDVYTSYDYAAPIPESGRIGAECESVRRLNGFIDRFEDELCSAAPETSDSWCPQHRVTRKSATHRFVFLRNPTRDTQLIPAPENERLQLKPWESQIRVYGPDRKLEAVSPEPVEWITEDLGMPPPLPRLNLWRFSTASPQLELRYDDASWNEIPTDALERNRIDMDALGVHYGFIWYRGSFAGVLDRLILDARHSYAVWINGALVKTGDQFRNRTGVGPDGARRTRVSLSNVSWNPKRNAVVILVESLGHNKGLTDDYHLPRGLVSIDTGDTRVSWRYRGGLVRGEQGMNPVVAFSGVERSGSESVVLPHGWDGSPQGVALYESSFSLEGIDPKSHRLALRFDPGHGKANLYLNGYLLGRYWPELGPQRQFVLPWGILSGEEENQLAITLWKRSKRATLGKVRLELI